MSDIVERLRMGQCHPGTISDPHECEAPEGECMCAIQSEAAEDIKELRNQLAERDETIRSLRSRVEELEKSGEQAARDVNHLLAVIDYMEEATGEGPDVEDVGLISQIRNEYSGGGSNA